MAKPISLRGYITTLEFCCRTIMPTRSASRQASALDPGSLPGQQQFLVMWPLPPAVRSLSGEHSRSSPMGHLAPRLAEDTHWSWRNSLRPEAGATI
jgi:hypothetical protein